MKSQNNIQFQHPKRNNQFISRTWVDYILSLLTKLHNNSKNSHKNAQKSSKDFKPTCNSQAFVSAGMNFETTTTTKNTHVAFYESTGCINFTRVVVLSIATIFFHTVDSHCDVKSLQKSVFCF